MSNALLRYDDSERLVTVLQVDGNLIHALWELNQRMRETQSQLFAAEGRKMLIEQLKTKLAALFDKAYANQKNQWLQKIILAVKGLLLANIDKVKPQIEDLFDQGKFDDAVDFLLAFSKGNVFLPIPWYLKLFAPSSSKLLDGLGVWLKANKGLFKEQIGSSLPPIE